MYAQALRQVVVERQCRHWVTKNGGRKYGVLGALVRKTSGQVALGKKCESKDAFELGPALVARMDDFIA